MKKLTAIAAAVAGTFAAFAGTEEIGMAVAKTFAGKTADLSAAFLVEADTAVRLEVKSF